MGKRKVIKRKTPTKSKQTDPVAAAPEVQQPAVVLIPAEAAATQAPAPAPPPAAPEPVPPPVAPEPVPPPVVAPATVLPPVVAQAPAQLPVDPAPVQPSVAAEPVQPSASDPAVAQPAVGNPEAVPPVTRAAPPSPKQGNSPSRRTSTGTSVQSRLVRRRLNFDATPPISITENELKTSFAQQLLAQRNAYLGYIEGQVGERLTADLGPQQWLDAEHVDGILRILFSKQPETSHTVGVYPVFNLEQLYGNAQTVIYLRLLRDPRFQHMRPDNTPLPELTGLSGEVLVATREANQQEQRRRNHQELRLRQEADRILEQNGIFQRNIFPIYLDCVVNNNQLLGNPAKPDLVFRDCEQFVIPLLRGKHYTVIVVDCYSTPNADGSLTRIADIKYYDSKGHDLDFYDPKRLEIGPLLRDQAVTFFRRDWQLTTYTCVSAPDQPDSDSCGLRAAFEAYNMVNDNYRIAKPRLSTGNTDIRGLSHILLRELGQDITAGPQPAAAPGTAPAVSTTNGNRELLIFCIEQFVAFTKQPLPAMENTDLMQLWQLCDAEFKRADELLKTLRAKANKNPEEIKQLQELQKFLIAYASIANEVKGVAQDERKKHKAPTMWDSFVEIFRGVPWFRVILITALLSTGTYFGGPYLVELAIMLGAYLPVNPITTIFAAAFVFIMSFQMVYWISNLVGISNEVENNPPPMSATTQQSSAQQPSVSQEFIRPEVEAVIQGGSPTPILHQSQRTSAPAAPVAPVPVPVAPVAAPAPAPVPVPAPAPRAEVITLDEREDNGAGVGLLDADLVVVGDRPRNTEPIRIS